MKKFLIIFLLSLTIVVPAQAGLLDKGLVSDSFNDLGQASDGVYNATGNSRFSVGAFYYKWMLSPITGATPQSIIVARIGSYIGLVISFAGIIALFFVVWGGFLWVTAGGNDEQVTKARKLIVNSLIALAIILMAYILTAFVVSYLIGVLNKS